MFQFSAPQPTSPSTISITNTSSWLENNKCIKIQLQKFSELKN